MRSTTHEQVYQIRGVRYVNQRAGNEYLSAKYWRNIVAIRWIAGIKAPAALMKGWSTVKSLYRDDAGQSQRLLVVSADVERSMAWPTQIKLISRQSWLETTMRRDANDPRLTAIIPPIFSVIDSATGGSVSLIGAFRNNWFLSIIYWEKLGRRTSGPARRGCRRAPTLD